MVKYRRSRLRRKEDARSLRRAVVFGGLTVVLALGLVFLGIPALIRMAIFLGNLRGSSQPVETGDTLAPSAPQLKSLPEATNSAQIKIEGFAEAGSTVEIFLSGMSNKEVVAESEGTFNASLRLTLGRNDILATATDENGNTSQKSDKLIIYYDNTSPSLEINEPLDNVEYFGEENTITIKGKTEEEVTITVNERMVIVDSEGNFEYPLNLSEGENLIQVKAIDKAGNITEEERKVTYSP